MACIDRDDWQGVGELMLASADKLARIGADFLICPDNTIHQALPYVAPRSPLPWLHIAEVVADEATSARLPAPRRSRARAGWSTARSIRSADGARTGLHAADAEERDEINRIIMDELVYGVFKPEAVAYLPAGHRRA